MLAIGACLAILGFVVGFVIHSWNRSRPSPEPDDGPSAAVTPPAELAGLGFLPPDTNLLAAVQPGPVLAYADRTNQDPRELLTKAGVPDALFTTLDRARLTLPQIDHVVVGANARELPRLVVVLVLRRPPADEEAFLRALDAHPDPRGKANRLVAQFNRNLPVEVARVSDRVWVFGLGDKDLAPADRGGLGPGARHLSAGLQEMLSQKLPPDAAAWAAADSDRWSENWLVKAAANTNPRLAGLPAVLAKGQAAVAGLSFGEPPRARLFVRCVDEGTGDRLRAYFQQKATVEGARAGGAGEWAMLDTPFDPRDGLRPVREFLDDIGK